jgi:hypothetical protein
MKNKMVRVMTFEVKVTVPPNTDESEVQSALDAALDEPPCDWNDWFVGGFNLVSVSKGIIKDFD